MRSLFSLSIAQFVEKIRETNWWKHLMNSLLHNEKIVERYFSVADAVKDDEIENWAAKKIQSSFKQYKHQKSTREKALPPTSEVSPPPSPTS